MAKKKTPFTIPVLKKSLNECAFTSKDKKLSFLVDANREYCLHRAGECIADLLLGQGDPEEQTRTAIQMLLMFRVKSDGQIQSEGKSANGTGSQGSN